MNKKIPGVVTAGHWVDVEHVAQVITRLHTQLHINCNSYVPLLSTPLDNLNKIQVSHQADRKKFLRYAIKFWETKKRALLKKARFLRVVRGNFYKINCKNYIVLPACCQHIDFYLYDNHAGVYDAILS